VIEEDQREVLGSGGVTIWNHRASALYHTIHPRPGDQSGRTSRPFYLSSLMIRLRSVFCSCRGRRHCHCCPSRPAVGRLAVRSAFQLWLGRFGWLTSLYQAQIYDNAPTLPGSIQRRQ
jgi:hypothetical protein